MLGTSPTPYDLKFTLLGIPVRVHPTFWIVAAIMGWRDNDLPAVAAWIGCVFVSILVHELGHGLMARRFWGEPRILLYGMGGLCESRGERTRLQRLAVILAGPGAGFALLGLTLFTSSLALGLTAGDQAAILGRLFGLGGDRAAFATAITKFPSHFLIGLYWNLVFINLMWGLVNLLPIWPLDGGQASQVLLSFADRGMASIRVHTLSLLTAGILAVVLLLRGSDWFLTLFFGLFAFINYQILQELHRSRAFGSRADDDWWRS
jgi:stage IV sporulation protein FB